MNGPLRIRMMAALAAALLLAGWTSCPRPGPAAEPAPGTTGAGAETVTLTGWFHIIWGDGERYYLTDPETGRTTELVLPPETLRAVGGPLTIDRRRVRVTGTRVRLSDASGAARDAVRAETVAVLDPPR